MTAEKQPPPPDYMEEDPTNAAHLAIHVAQAVNRNAPESSSSSQGQGLTEQGYPDEKSAYAYHAAAEQSIRDSVRASRILSADSYNGFHTRPDGTVENADDSSAVPPPAYSETYGEIKGSDANLGTDARVCEDGRVNIKIDQRSKQLSSILVPALRQQLNIQKNEKPLPPPYIPTSLGGSPGELPPPPLNVVIHVVGSRGDVQPFVALGKVLKETYKHRVRLATHPVFKKFVEENGLEFFSIGGDPAELMAFMVKNPGLMPGFDVLRSGDIGKRRRGIEEMIKGCWRSCIEAGDGSGMEASNSNIPNWTNNDEPLTPEQRPFVADCIIANPPSFAHIHIAEKMGIPLHMMFTMPWSATQSFPHPLANIVSSNADPNITNYISYALVDMLTWQGLGDIINRFRVHSLGLEPISLLWAPGLLDKLKVPYTYCWSPALIPKPNDWRQHITISGFYFLSLASNYTPEPSLKEFLQAGPPPVYIGFGSIVVDDPNAMTNMIFEAVRKTGQRALVSKGWGGIGGDDLNVPEGVYMLGNVPHDWLFEQVSCVVHHGGAGTTAAGIAAGRPTVVVPFFGDQPFWGAMVNKAGAGPPPIHHKELTADNLAGAILEALKPASLQKAGEMKAKISKERGSHKGAQTFHQMLDVDKLRCSLIPEHAAVWRVRRTQIRLSALAAYILAEKQVITFGDLKLYRPREYDTETGPPDFITGGAGALTGTISTMMMGIADLPVETLKALKIHPDAAKKKAAAAEAGASSSSSNPASASTASLAGDSTYGTEKAGTSVPSTPGTETPTDEKGRPRGRSMANALRSMSSRSRSRSRSNSTSRENLGPPSPSGNRTPQRPSSSTGNRDRSASQVSYTPNPNPSSIVDTAMATGKGFSRILGAGIKSPMDFTLAISKGFHNTPKLFGDDVRQVDRVTDLQSGLKVAGKEFGLGVFEGVTGLFTKPVEGAKKDGVAGFVKGIGKGIVGVSTKPSAGFMAIPAYTMKGVYKEIQKNFSANIDGYIIAARTAQGWEEYQKTGPEDHKEIVQRYLALLKEVKGKRSNAQGVEISINQFIERRKAVRRERWEKLQADGHADQHDYSDDESDLGVYEEQPPSQPGAAAEHQGYYAPTKPDNVASQPSGSQTAAPRSRPPSYVPYGLSEKQRLEVERQLSERGRIESEDDFDDPLAPLAAKYGLTGEQKQPSTQQQASSATAGVASSSTAVPAPPHSPIISQGAVANDADLIEAIKRSIAETSTGDETEDDMIARAVRASIAELRRQKTQTIAPLDSTSGSAAPPAPARARAPPPALPSRSPAPPQQSNDDEDEEMMRAIEESRKMHEQMEKDRQEEDIVMEYVKKASMAESGFQGKEKR